MNSSVVLVALLFAVSCAFTLSSAFSWKKLVQKSPLVPTEEEQALCAAAAAEAEEELISVRKVFQQTCYVKCKYGSGDNVQEDSLYSPKDTLCCDMVGLGPTGKCDGNGKCNPFVMNEMVE